MVKITFNKRSLLILKLLKNKLVIQKMVYWDDFNSILSSESYLKDDNKR